MKTFLINGVEHRWINEKGEIIERTDSVPEHGYTLQRSLDSENWVDVFDNLGNKMISPIKKILDFGV